MNMKATGGIRDDGQLWTYIVRCATCGRECNRAEHVPERDRGFVALGAPMLAFCAVPEHNSLSDLNFHYTAEWVREPAAPSDAHAARGEEGAA